MDSPGVQIKLDSVSPPEAPKSRDVAPVKKRDDQDETKDAAAAAAALTVSFADILRSKRQDIKTGAEGREKTDPLLQANGQLAAGRKRLRQPAIEVQAKETLDHAKELAGAAMKAATGKGINGDGQEAVQSADLTKKGALTPAEEALLKEMIQKNGNLAAQKKAAQMTGFVNGEPLNRREGIGAVKSMTAKERGDPQESLGRRGGRGAEEVQGRQIGQDTAGLRDARHSRRHGKSGPGRFVGRCDEAGNCRLGRGPAGQAGCSGFDEKTGGNGRYKSRDRAVQVPRRRNDFRSSGQGHGHPRRLRGPRP